MWDWLFAPIDPSRGHDVGFALSWHARVMTLAWGVVVPSAVLAARYLKIMPGQDWPQELDNKTWWHSHWMGQSFAYLLSFLGLGLILSVDNSNPAAGLHRWLGYTVLAFGTLQILLGVYRGSKGGPTAPASDGSPRGDHYDMTRWRLCFERMHRVLGYLALILGLVTIVTGLWAANGPHWMWIMLTGWWIGLLFLAAICQVRGRAFDTYQAIWGPDPDLPGNRRPKAGWATVRPGDKKNRKPRKGAE